MNSIMRPHVFINVAASADGRISDESRRQIRISCEEDMQRVDRLRAESDAIVVGIGTVLSDDPRLTVKSQALREERVKNGRTPNPLRVVVDSRARTPLNARVLDGEAETLVAVSDLADEERVAALREKASVFVAGQEKVDLRALMEYLYSIGVRRVMVEGGARLNHSLIAEGLVDEIMVYYGGMIIGNGPCIADGPSFKPPVPLELVRVSRLGSGVLAVWKVLADKS
ncbi:2,5-diamino-6-(ribosylamino)-4(3H)-pyrimidinone 5'-phosphate reductase [Archaeoglobus veneficus]|uniref:2,5-diamino-6-(ribosylamino)-4(3H)-pyrimidinone 5'-phosphate reductase n=1 Tax=Archaeoglobus veneficus (strain DSM 11195 / SNP6) TaxID=693661 RepID=F2KSH2_ARCVS|nr:2,5-diamino-6-(ribosylamino)-4(3H)-pyrimidinone 5'-phosphate reductase [Archaeoglobus veneficus]AEA46941.1 2,5-diamino-6-hydroxy-4-(5-phosphoribosylamino) pyrimidine1-reductase [Archaeoglobus veneficus SNP6]